MSEKVLIYGKNTWPYTNAAREAMTKQGRQVEYLNVAGDEDRLKAMLAYSKGVRKVPVIVDQGDVSIGFEGGSWGV